VVCWGDNDQGQAPPGPSADTFKAVAVGYNFSCGIRADDKLACWGRNDRGQAPPGPSSDPFKSITLSRSDDDPSFACGVRMDDSVACWGQIPSWITPPASAALFALGSKSYCGVGLDGLATCTSESSITTYQPADVGMGPKAVSVTDHYACFIRADDSVTCDAGVPLAGGGYESLSAGSSFACAIHAGDQRLDCQPANRKALPPGPYGQPFGSVSVGMGNNACAIALDGRVTCWGDNLGDAPPMPRSDTFASVMMNGPVEGMCGVRTEGAIVCWGDGDDLGGSPTGPSTDTFIAASGGSQHLCGVRSDGAMVCWGSDGNRSGTFALPAGTFKSVAVNGDSSCAIRSDDRVVCWDGLSPTEPLDPLPDAFDSIDLGEGRGCGVRIDDGAIACWGSDVPDRLAAQPLAGAFTAVSVGQQQVCGLDADGRASCAGVNHGGEAPAGPSLERYKVFRIGGAFPHGYACGVRADDDRVVCQGDNSFGQAPPGPSLDRFRSVTLGLRTACGVRLDGHLLCWGAQGL